MAIYVFNLLVGWAPNGVDNAQGYRAKMLNHFVQPVNYIFTDLPRREDIAYYSKLGIGEEQMLSIHFFLANHCTLNTSVEVKNKVEELMKKMPFLEVEYQDMQVLFKCDEEIVIKILLDERERKYLWRICYFKHNKLIRKETFADGIVYTEYYKLIKSEDGKEYEKLIKRTFYYPNGQIAYSQLIEEGKEWYLFPDEKIYTKQQFIGQFIRKINLSKADTVLMDRGAQFDFVQPVFQFGKSARFIAVMHSEHYFDKGRDCNWLY